MLSLNLKNIKFLFLSCIALIISGKLFSQDIEFPEDKVTYSINVVQKGCIVSIIADIDIEEGWHINGANLPLESFSIPTNLFLDTSSMFIIEDSIYEPEVKRIYDNIAKEDLYLHEGKIKISRKVIVNSEKDFVIKGVFTFQTCDDSHCLPPYDGPFEVKVKGCDIQNLSDKTFNSTKTLEEKKKTITNEIVKKKLAVENDIEIEESKTNSKSIFFIFIISFLSGFAALITPCVFPMIPLTVSFFTKQSKDKVSGFRNAILYALCIIIIYVLLGTIVTGLFGASFLNSLSTNIYFNLFFFLLLILFAVSFLGAFEINLPNTWINKADSASRKGGFIGIFFMAFTLALVSFSCTGPIVGTLLVESATIGGIGPFVGMFGFSLALALPFGLFAAFPGWLNSLPKSGGWLNTVKVFLGFLELALAFKFLSNADLVMQGHFLERELFIAIWIGIFFVLALYLFGFFKLPNDGDIKFISVSRTLLATAVLIFVMYLIPGLWGAPLKLISGFPPPMSYSESPIGIGTYSNTDQINNTTENTHSGPQGLPVFHDLEEGLAYAKSVNKPSFLDFTGHACINCRKMEEKVWGEEGVFNILRDSVVIISLYVDDKRPLPDDQHFEEEIAPGKVINVTTIGDKWSAYQAKKYKSLSQPYYRMLDKNGDDLSNGSADYLNHGNKQDFLKWLRTGLEQFKRT
ncbi:MAG: thiol:disulfide interchange protein [Crocinitomicaceae bacterium]|nr:thiol:disulfide interchange protein [Crocinitomicaceae bacterium]